MKEKFIPFVGITLASLLYAVGFNWCYAPNHIGYGGVTGIAQIINATLPWAPIGTVVILLNVPLFLLGWKFIGGKLLVSSLYSMLISSVAIDLLNAVYVFQPMDEILATIYGGVIMGISLGVIFLYGATTGGTDVVARLLKLKVAWLPMGKLLLFIDLTVIVAVAAAFGNLHSALYGVVALYISSKVMDMVLYGMDTAKVAYIVSDHHHAITQRIIQELDRGVTLLEGEGGWSGEDKRVLMCAFKQRQIVTLKHIVKEVDPAAFLIVCDAHEVLGEGFRSYKQSDL